MMLFNTDQFVVAGLGNLLYIICVLMHLYRSKKWNVDLLFSSVIFCEIDLLNPMKNR